LLPSRRSPHRGSSVSTTPQVQNPKPIVVIHGSRSGRRCYAMAVPCVVFSMFSVCVRRRCTDA
jgi:hypothetical protein